MQFMKKKLLEILKFVFCFLNLKGKFPQTNNVDWVSRKANLETQQ